MYKIKVQTKQDVKEFQAVEGENLLIVLAKNNIFISANCGGKGTCGKCKVNVVEGKVKGQTQSGILNSCQATIIEDITIKVNSIVGEGITQSKPIEIVAENKSGYGIAVDIGTTTVVCYLVSLETGKDIDVSSELNNQAVYGSDVISRINLSTNVKLKDLENIITSQIDRMIKTLCEKNSINKIEKIIISGNTTMLHLFAGIDPTPMGKSPFKPVFTQTKTLKDGEIILLPSASAYIGSDIVCGLVASGMLSGEINLFIDIGTNGEIAIANICSLSACATAAGPAFEGANIEKGMGGVKGAIDHITYKNGKLSFSTIEGEAEGICGSGLIDIMAILIENGIIDETGAFDEIKDKNLMNHMFEDKFYINKNVYISQKDIREFQLAKSAVCSGILTLLRENNLLPEQINKVYLAGGFGYYLSKENAVKTGLLPKEFSGKIECVGNTSGLGAKMCLVNSKYITECEQTAEKIQIIELASNQYFMDCFIENMGFEVKI